jgi:hypothetical protein
MRRRPRTNVDPERSERLTSIEIARAQLFDVDAARTRPIDSVIDYFGGGREAWPADARSESWLDMTGAV